MPSHAWSHLERTKLVKIFKQVNHESNSWDVLWRFCGAPLGTVCLLSLNMHKLLSAPARNLPRILKKVPQWNFKFPTSRTLTCAKWRIQLNRDGIKLPRFNCLIYTLVCEDKFIRSDSQVRNVWGRGVRARIYGGGRTKGNTHSALCDSIGVRHATFWCAFYTPPAVYDQFPSARADCIFMCTAKEQKKSGRATCGVSHSWFIHSAFFAMHREG